MHRVVASIVVPALAVIMLISSGCQNLTGSQSPNPNPNPNPQPSASLNSINHIIFMAQENRSLDSYFGALRGYWAANGIPDQAFDGLPQFTPPANSALGPTNPGCDPTLPYPVSFYCHPDASNPVPSFHFQTMCVENPSPSWPESHRDFNVNDPTSGTPTLDGFVTTAADVARQITSNASGGPYFDVDGMRAMGYYDGGDLNYYYAMATNFATSDRWFSPVMSRTPPNREFLIAATSNGYVNQRGKNPPFDSALIPAKTIFEALQAAGITWKIYVPNVGTQCASDTSPSCLIKLSYVKDFTFGQTIVNQYPQNLVPISQFITDAQNGTLPQVAQIEPASGPGLDEHPSDNDPPAGGQPCCSTQKGAQFVSTLINAVMCAPNSNPCTPGKSWKDSAFILTFDEFGGFYDHVAPVPTVSPDGIPPVDLYPNDVCLSTPGPTCDFTYTGYRVPMIVVSPFAKKNFVSHATTDYTAILKLIEKRFGLGALTNRDAAQIDMALEFFDFTNQPWMTPPNPPKQDTSKACYLDHLP